MNWALFLRGPALARGEGENGVAGQLSRSLWYATTQSPVGSSNTGCVGLRLVVVLPFLRGVVCEASRKL